MYKEIIITVLIVTLIFGLDIITSRYTANAIDELSQNLDELKTDLDTKSEDNIEEKTNNIFKKWREYYDVLAYYIEHDELEKVETQLTMLRSDQNEKQYEECKKEIDTTKFILKHIENKEKFTLQSVF